MAFRDTNKNNGYHSVFVVILTCLGGGAFFPDTVFPNMLLCDKKQFYNSRYRSCFLRAQVLTGVVCCRNKTLSSLIVIITVVSIWVQLSYVDRKCYIWSFTESFMVSVSPVVLAAQWTTLLMWRMELTVNRRLCYNCIYYSLVLLTLKLKNCSNDAKDLYVCSKLLNYQLRYLIRVVKLPVLSPLTEVRSQTYVRKVAASSSKQF